MVFETDPKIKKIKIKKKIDSYKGLMETVNYISVYILPNSLFKKQRKLINNVQTCKISRN